MLRGDGWGLVAVVLLAAIACDSSDTEPGARVRSDSGSGDAAAAGSSSGGSSAGGTGGGSMGSNGAGGSQQPRPPPCDPDAGADRPPDTNDDVYGLDGCRPTPARLVVLGDSIADSFGGGAESPTGRMATWLRARGAPGLRLEHYAVAGARVADLEGQARRAAPGPGHVFVWIFAIGIDLKGGGFLTPNSDLSPLRAGFEKVFAYFGDKGSFPDGATFLLNTQYGSFDQCTRPDDPIWSYPGPAIVEWLLHVNKTMFLDVAEGRDDTVAVDQYPDFLGHAANANIEGCPYCGPDNTPWTVGDGVHLNGAGNAHIAQKWLVAFDRMLPPSCETIDAGPGDGGTDARADAGATDAQGDGG